MRPTTRAQKNYFQVVPKNRMVMHADGRIYGKSKSFFFVRSLSVPKRHMLFKLKRKILCEGGGVNKMW
jgi:hypothetical protein